MTQFTCKGVKQINNRISFKHLYHSYLHLHSTTVFISAGDPNGEFPEILIAKCRSRFFCTWFFSRAEDFESWREGRKGPSKSGEKCSRRKDHMYGFIIFMNTCAIRCQWLIVGMAAERLVVVCLPFRKTLLRTQTGTIIVIMCHNL